MRHSGLRRSGRSIIASVAASATLAGILVGVAQSPAAAATPPVAVNDAYTTTLNAPLVQAAPGVLANDTDDAGPLTASAPSDPPHGSMSLSANGSFTYTPDANFVGTDTFTYTVSDGVDGSSNGTVTITVKSDFPVLLKDLNPGAPSSQPSRMVDAGNGTALFVTQDPAFKGVWKTDGTTAGTVLLKSIEIGGSSDIPTPLPPVSIGGGRFVFWANDGVTGKEPWITDGTPAGTTIIKDINLGASGSITGGQFTALGSTVLFQANDGTNGQELWKTDGTAAGTAMVKDISAGSGSSAPNCGASVGCNGFAVLGSSVIFTATTAAEGAELWKSDGTTGGTVMLQDIRSGATGSTPTNFFVFGSTVLFAANDGVVGSELWKTDGTVGGASLVKDITASSANSTPSRFTQLGGIVVFSASTTALGNELYKTDGTPGGTGLVLDIRPGSGGAAPTGYTVLGGMVVFSANDGTTAGFHGVELWRTDGTAAGTTLVKDILPGTSGSQPSLFVTFGGLTYFDALHDTYGFEIWRTDGTETGTQLVQDINAVSGAGFAAPLGVAFGTMIMTAHDGITGQELWRLAPPNTAPVAVNDAYSTNEDTALVVAAPGVVGNDTDANSNPLHDAVRLTDPAHGSVTFNGDGSFTYTPAANYNGPDSFTYKSYDGMDYSNVATVNLTVTAVADAPVAVDDSYSTGQNTSLTVTAPGVLGNDTDPEGDPLTAGSASVPLHGAVALNPNGGFNYIPNNNYTGPDSFTYVVSDGLGGTDTGQVNITISVAAISASPSTVTAGDPVTATWSGVASPSPTDWVGLYASSSDPNPALLAWAYTGGGAAGSLNLTVPANSLPAGTYELRLFSNNTYTRLATSAPFTVTASATTISASPASVTAGGVVMATWSGIAAPTGTDWVGLYDSASAPNHALLAWAYTGGGAAGNLNLTVPGGSTPGAAYELRLFTANTYTRLATSAPFTVTASAAAVAATPSTVNAGDPVTATWSGIASPNATDWVGLYGSAGDPNPSILAWAYTGGAAAGNLNLTVPVGSSSAPTYELRLFSNNTYTRLATSAPFSVVASAATVAASPATVAAGSDVTATWSGIGSPNAQDWIGLYASGADPDTAIVGEVIGCCQVDSWAYTAGAAGGSFTLHVPAGASPGSSYELRLFSNNSYTRLATSAPFSVT